jgi:hypothetical protein
MIDRVTAEFLKNNKKLSSLLTFKITFEHVLFKIGQILV